MLSFLLAAGLSLFTSLGLNKYLPQYLQHLGVKKDSGPDHLRWSIQAKPLTGGLAMAIPFWIVLIILHYFQPLLFSRALLLFFITAFLIGLADDIYSLSPIVKFIAQLLCGVLIWMNGMQIHLSGLYYPDLAITALWVAGILNALNMLDNMDGVAGIAIVSILMPGLITAQADPFIYFFILSVTGILVGFLRYNLFPARIFMGDSGSHMLGAMLVWFSFQRGWNGIPELAPVWDEFIYVYALLLFPFTDTFLVIVSRLLRRKSPFIGGKDHLTHILVYKGIPQKYISVFILFINMLTGYWIIILKPDSGIVLGWVLIFSTLMGGVYYQTWQRHRRLEG